MEVVTNIFDGLMGQARAKAFLGAAFANDKLPQTMIFVGPKGVGRKTTATMLARAVHNNPQKNHPDTFMFADVLEELRAQDQAGPMRAATDALIKFLSRSPIASRCKVAIIENAEDLSEASQNALLKTLEEPLGDSLLILTAEDEQRMLPTITSRAVPVTFTPLTDGEMKQALPQIGDAILLAAQGSAGWAKLMMEQPERWNEEKSIANFWLQVFESTTEERFRWAETMREREDAIRFLRSGLRVWHQEWLKQPDITSGSRLARLQQTVMQVRDNVNPRVAMEALLLGV